MKNKVTLVPENIIFQHGWKCWDWDSLWIVFNKQKQLLIYSEENLWVYQVTIPSKDCFVKCKLVKVNPKDRQVGHTYYRSDYDLDYLHDISQYCKYLWEDKYVCINHDTDVRVLAIKFNDRYQVVPV